MHELNTFFSADYKKIDIELIYSPNLLCIIAISLQRKIGADLIKNTQKTDG